MASTQKLLTGRSSQFADGAPAGGDLSGTYPDPTVSAITETSGPTALVIGTITDGEFVKRSGATLISAGASLGPGPWIYGAGQDGALSLGGNTTLAAGDCIRQFTDLSLNGFTLTITSTDTYLIIYVSGTLSLGSGGVIKGVTASTGGGGGSGGNASTNGGAGGSTLTSILIFAKAITGSGTISAEGVSGVNGGNADTGGANANGNGGTAGDANVRVFGTAITGGGAGAGGGSKQTVANTPPATGAAGVAGAGGTTFVDTTRKNIINDLNQVIFRNDFSSLTGSGSPRCWNGAPGGGGGGGGHASVGAGATHVAGAGGGGGGASFIASGGAGGKGGDVGAAGTQATDNQGGGGGGGGGGSGGLVIVWSDSVPSGLIVSANGGNGGNGGNASGAGGNGGGAGGGGGGGGLAILVANNGNTATCQANGGTKGTAGGSVNGGTSPTTAVDGAAGRAWKIYL